MKTGWRQLMMAMAGVAAAASALPVVAAPVYTPVAKPRTVPSTVPTTVPTAVPTATKAIGAWKPNPDDQLLLDVHIAQFRLGDGTRGYDTPDGVCVDLADMILALDLPVQLDKKSRRATGWLFDEKRTLTIDREANTVQIMNGSAQLAPKTIQDTPEGWCVNVATLAQWMGIKIKVDKGNAVLVLVSDTKLPMQSMMERKARAANMRPTPIFDLKSLPQARVTYAGVKLPAVDVVASVGGLRDAQAGSTANFSYEVYASGEIGPVSYDARIASDQIGLPASLRLRAYRTDPNGGLLGPLHATHYEIGDVTGVSTPLSSQTTSGRGVMVTNQPVERPTNFSSTTFTGELPNGWDAELYRNGQLLAIAQTRADGRYAFDDVALLFGQNHFEIILYGPQGQLRKQQQDISVGANSIPPRKTYYWAGIDQDGHDLINLTHNGIPQFSGWRGSFGLERGLNAKTSVSAMFSSLVLRSGDGRRNYMEFSLRRSLGPALFEVSESTSLTDGGTAWRAQMLAQFGKTYLTAESINAFHRYESDRVLQGVTGIQRIAVDQSIKIGGATLPLHIESKLTTYAAANDTLDTTARLSANLGRWLMTAGLDWQKQFVKTGPPAPDSLDADILVNGRIGRVMVRGETRFSIAPQPRFQSINIIGEWQAGHGDPSTTARWRAELGYDSGRDRVNLGMGYIRQFKKVAVSATGEVASDGSVAAGLNLAFSFGPKPNGGVRMSSVKLASHGSVLVRVFRDLNHNGIHDYGEPWEKGVQVISGHVPVFDATNAQGEVMVDGLEPFEPVLIGIDGGSLPDPLMQPETVGLVAIPRPGVVQEIELAVATAGEVDGTLVRPGGGHLEGVDVELIDLAGQVAGHARSEFDGYVLFDGVPYGRYTIRLAKLSAETLKVVQNLNIEALVGDKKPSVHLGTIVIGKPVAK